MIRVGIVGYGYWGPNLARAVAESGVLTVEMIADVSTAALERAARRHPSTRMVADWRALVADPAVDAVMVATPVHTHFEIALAALRAGKHVLVEKPMTDQVATSALLIEEAARRGLVLMVDHTFVYTGAVRTIADLVSSGKLGDVYYYNSTRVNLGLFQRDVNVIWDLAVHDFSIMDHLLTARPVAVSASGACFVPSSPENMAHLSVYYDDGSMAHLNVNWLAPVKIRQTLIGGSRRMVLYDDMQTSEKVKVYDRGVSLGAAPRASHEQMISYRIGEMFAPVISAKEALLTEVEEFARCVETGGRPITDGESGLRVVEMLGGGDTLDGIARAAGRVHAPEARLVIPFLDLSAQYDAIGPELEEAVVATLRSGNYVLGENVARFEERFAAYCGTEHAVALSSGTAALHLALAAAGIGPGDEVITVPMTFVATVAAIVYSGAAPVFVDIDPETWTMDPAAIEAAITPRTRALMPVHLHGRLSDMDAICRIARRHGLLVVEDAAQAHGAERGGVRAGAVGDIGCFSFYPGKNLGACGEGGAITTNRADLADLVRSLRDWGQQGKYNHVRHGFNYRMDAVQGAALGVKLDRLDDWNARRRRVANAYDAGLAGGIVRAAGPFGTDHAAHVYAIQVPDRDALRERLATAGVATNIHYPRPVHLQPAYAGLGHGPGAFPVSEMFAAETLSLPLYPELSTAQVAEVITVVNRLATDAAAVSPLVATA